jgi:hypothetical protein
MRHVVNECPFCGDGVNKQYLYNNTIKPISGLSPCQCAAYKCSSKEDSLGDLEAASEELEIHNILMGKW